MLHPVGKLPPAIYWRRRLVFVGIPLLLIILLLWLIFGGGGSNKKVADPSSPASIPVASSAPASPKSTPPPSTSASPTPTPIGNCPAAALSVTASSDKPSYAVGSQPNLYLTVTNTGATPCKQDLADPQIEWLVYTGDARVWGSHDCQVTPGTDVQTLNPKAPVRRAVQWSGQTSVPGCGGTRLVAQAGTYTLYAKLSGKQSPAATFTLA